jgi:hypothetical protein
MHTGVRGVKFEKLGQRNVGKPPRFYRHPKNHLKRIRPKNLRSPSSWSFNNCASMVTIFFFCYIFRVCCQPPALVSHFYTLADTSCRTWASIGTTIEVLRWKEIRSTFQSTVSWLCSMLLSTDWLRFLFCISNKEVFVLLCAWLIQIYTNVKNIGPCQKSNEKENPMCIHELKPID